MWPAQDQADSELRIVIDDLEEALLIARNGLAKTVNSLIAGKPLDEETLKTVLHNIKASRDIAALGVTDFDWRATRAIHLLRKALRPCERANAGLIVQYEERD